MDDKESHLVLTWGTFWNAALKTLGFSVSAPPPAPLKLLSPVGQWCQRGDSLGHRGRNCKGHEGTIDFEATKRQKHIT